MASKVRPDVVVGPVFEFLISKTVKLPPAEPTATKRRFMVPSLLTILLCTHANVGATFCIWVGFFASG